MRRPAVAVVLIALLALPPLSSRAALADEAAAPVPGPLRPLPLPLSVQAEPPASRPAPTPQRPPQPPRAVPPVAPPRQWTGTLKPTAPGELGAGRVLADVGTREIRITDLAVTEAPGLEVLLVAADAVPTTEAVLAAKRVSVGRIKRLRPQLSFHFPAELDLAVYRSLIVWSRHDRAPRAVARLAPGRGD